MATTMEPREGMHSDDEEEILTRASENGFRFVQYETPTGQLVFEWRQGDGSGPQFVTRRIALHWMVDWLERGHPEIAS